MEYYDKWLIIWQRWIVAYNCCCWGWSSSIKFSEIKKWFSSFLLHSFVVYFHRYFHLFFSFCCPSSSIKQKNEKTRFENYKLFSSFFIFDTFLLLIYTQISRKWHLSAVEQGARQRKKSNWVCLFCVEWKIADHDVVMHVETGMKFWVCMRYCCCHSSVSIINSWFNSIDVKCWTLWMHSVIVFFLFLVFVWKLLQIQRKQNDFKDFVVADATNED